MEPIILIGGGGHCRSCIDVIEQEGRFSIAGIVERKSATTENFLDYPLIGHDDELYKLRQQFENALVTIGQIKINESRINLFSLLKELKFKLPFIVSPHAFVSKHALIGEGTIVMHHALVNAGAIIGMNCILNTKTLVEHDAVLDNHCHLAPGSIINGEVSIGSGTFVGSGSVIRECIKVGKNSVIAARSVVIENLPESSFFRNTF